MVAVSGQRGRGAAAALLLLAAAAAGCAQRDLPVLEPLRELPLRDRVPIVVIPGFTGTQLVESETGKLQWGSARRVFLPRDRGHGGVLPLDPQLAAANDVGAGDTVWRMKFLGLFPVKAYIPLVRLFEANGYRLGHLRDPRPDDTLFFFAYDWRRDTEHAVRRLAEQLERLRRVRGESVLHVAFICQSGGGRIGRWYTKYGDRSLAEIEAGARRTPANVVVDKIVLVGSANGGALRVFDALHNGRRYVPVVGRLFSAELFFTFRGLFDELPVYDDTFFVDREGRPLDVDLFDAANWERYGWSIYRDRPRQKADRDPERFGNAATRAAYLQRNLERARRLQRWLQSDVEPAPPTRYYQIQSSFRPTPTRALLHRKKDGTWVTAFLEDGRVAHDPSLSEIVTEPGDGHASVRSQRAMAPQELEAVEGNTLWVDGTHFAIVNEPATRRALLDILVEPLPSTSDVVRTVPER